MSLTPGTPFTEFDIDTVDAEDLNNAQIIRNAMGIELPILQNIASLNKAFDGVQQLDNASGASPVRRSFTAFADSMPGYVALWLAMDLGEKYGVGALYTPNLGLSWNGASSGVVLAGSAAALTSNYDYMPSACLVNLPAGGSYTLPVPEQSTMNYFGGGELAAARITTARNRIPLPNGIRTVRIFYVVEPGAGSITGTLTQTQFANVTSTVSADGAAALGVMDLTVADPYGAFTFAVSAASAAVKFIGAAFLSGSGVSYFSSSKGSTKMDDQLPGLRSGNTVWNPVYKSLLASLNCDWVLHTQRATDAGTEANNALANYQIFFDAYEEAAIGQVYWEEPSRAPAAENGLTTDVINAGVEIICRESGIAYFARKRIVAPSSGVGLGWGDGDNIHRDYPSHRYESGVFLMEVNDFRSAFGRYGTGVSPGRLDQERLRLGGVDAAQRITETWRNGRTLDGSAVSTYSAATVDTERGVRFASTAALGHAAARIGLFNAGDATIRTDVNDLVISGSGYRNVSIVNGLEAFLVFGGNSTTLTTIAGLAQRCFGIHFAFGTSIGFSFTGQEYARIFVCDGTTTTYSRWIPIVTSGGAASSNGCKFVLRWDRTEQRLFLSMDGNQNQLNRRASLLAPSLASNNTAGAWIHAGVFAANTNFGNGAGASPTPAGAGAFQWREMSCQHGFAPSPYGW